MRKISLITTAVLTALSANVYAADWSTGTEGFLNVKEDGFVGYDTVTIVGAASSSDYKKSVSVYSPNSATFKNVVMDGASGAAGSYFKTWTAAVTIDNLTVNSADSFGMNTLEFWNAGGSDQSFEIASTTIGNNSVLRIQESADANPNSSSVIFGKVNLQGKSAIVLGVNNVFGGEKQSADTVSIDEINVVNGDLAGIAAAASGDKNINSVVQVGSINIENSKFSMALTADDVPSGFIDQLGAKFTNVTLTGQEKNGGVVTVNMNTSDSALELGNIDKNGELSTTLDINFTQEAFNSEVSNVTFGEGANVATGTNLSLTAENAAKGSNAENVKALNKLLGKVEITGDHQTFASTSLTATSDVFDTVTAQTKDGKVDTSTMRTHENAEVFSFAQLHSVGVMQWREEMNHMQLRLGEIRDAAGYNNGAWARIYNGKDEYGSQDVENKYYGVQVGYDHRLEGTNWIIGGAFSYARGDSTFSTGEGDNHNFTFTGYGTWLADNGLFVDVTGKIGRLSNDITIDHYTSDYDTNALSVTAEAGWRFALNDIFYVEPQAEMMYGHIMSADYRTQTYKADTEAVDMWVGRLGFQTGLTCPEKKGGVYFRASVLHDFDGDAETKFTGLKSGDTRKVLDELGGTWYEMGIGANYNVTDNTYLYADFQYANGGEIDTPWRWNLGVRVNF